MHDHGLVDNTPKVRRVLILTLVLNELVAAAKIAYGYTTGSLGMMSDGVHSLFDGVSNIVGLVGIWIASRPPDEDHPYGHKKFETFFTMIIAVMIFGTCFQIFKLAYESVFVGKAAAVATDLSFIVMGVTIAINIFVMLYESRKGRELNSDFLIADAMHTKSDILASVAVVVGLIFTRAGLPFADTVAGVIITFFIARIGYKIIMRASDTLVDTVRLDTSAVGEAVMTVPGVKGTHDIRTRGLKHLIYMDLHILVDPQMTTGDAHCVAEDVEAKLRKVFEGLRDVVVHVEPVEEGEDPTSCHRDNDVGDDDSGHGGGHTG